MSDTDKLVDEGETMAEMWEGFRQKVCPRLPPNSPSLHLAEGSFYAGALCLHNWTMRAGTLSEGLEPTDEDVAKMQRMEAEIHAFFVAQAIGKL